MIAKIVALVALLVGALWGLALLVERLAVPGWQDETGFHHGRRPRSVRTVLDDEGDAYLQLYGVGSDARPEVHLSQPSGA